MGSSTLSSARPTVARLGDLLDAWHQDAVAANEAYRFGTARGPVTGFANLDEELGGALSPDVHILHGSPGVGKTAWALQAAATAGSPALYVSAEMGGLELFRRVTARVTRTFLGRFRTGELAPETSDRFAARAAAEAPDLVLADATMAPAPLDWIRDMAESVRGNSPYLHVVVDSVHSWAEALDPTVPEYEAINAGIADLRALSKQLGCSVLGIAERNRASMKTGGLSAASGSRKFEYSASTVIDLSCDPDKHVDAAGEVPVELKISKNRNGTAGRKFNLMFLKACQSFREA